MEVQSRKRPFLISIAIPDEEQSFPPPTGSYDFKRQIWCPEGSSEAYFKATRAGHESTWDATPQPDGTAPGDHVDADYW